MWNHLGKGQKMVCRDVVFGCRYFEKCVVSCGERWGTLKSDTPLSCANMLSWQHACTFQGFWSKTSDTCCISSRKTHPHALSKTFLSLSISFSLYLSISLFPPPSLSHSLAPSLSPSLCLSPLPPFLALPLLFPLLLSLPLSLSLSDSLSLYLSLLLSSLARTRTRTRTHAPARTHAGTCTHGRTCANDLEVWKKQSYMLSSSHVCLQCADTEKLQEADQAMSKDQNASGKKVFGNDDPQAYYCCNLLLPSPPHVNKSHCLIPVPKENDTGAEEVETPYEPETPVAEVEPTQTDIPDEVSDGDKGGNDDKGECKEPQDLPPPDQLSWGAVDRRLRRIMTPRVTGEFQVPKAVVDQWNDKTTRPRVMSMFEKAGYSPDRVHGRVVGFRWSYQYIINIYIYRI